MKNVKINALRNASFGLSSELCGLCWDDSSDDIVLADSNALWRKSLTKLDDSELVRFAEFPLGLSLVSSLPFEKNEFHHLSCLGASAFCVADKTNIAVIVNEEGNDEQLPQSLTVDEGISALSWSPDGSVGVLVTDDKTVHLLTPGLEVVNSFDLEQEGFGEAQPITVGWGKKETQFHGSEGKAAAVKAKEVVKASAGWDNGDIFISWEPNGQSFAISWITQGILFSETLTLSSNGGHRQLRVFSVSGDLHSTGETVSGMEQGLAWRPNTHFIACVDRTPHGVRVIFFERNGLRHGQFIVAPTNHHTAGAPSPNLEPSAWPHTADSLKISNLQFNSDGSLLAVHLTTLQDDSCTSQASIIRLYSTDNYHWYGKCDIPFPQTNHVQWLWSLSRPNDMIIAHSTGGHAPSQHSSIRVSHYAWCWSTDVSAALNDDRVESGLVTLIDKDEILCSPLATMVIPPPMCGFVLKCPQTVNYVSLPGGLSPVSCCLGSSGAAATVCPILLQLSHASAPCLVIAVPLGEIVGNASPSSAASVEKERKAMFSLSNGAVVSAHYHAASTGGKGFRPRCQLPIKVEEIPALPGMIQHSHWLDCDNCILLLTGGTFHHCSRMPIPNQQGDNSSSAWSHRQVLLCEDKATVLTFCVGNASQLYVIHCTGQMHVYNWGNVLDEDLNYHILEFPLPSSSSWSGSLQCLPFAWTYDENNLDCLPPLFYLDPNSFKFYIAGKLASNTLLFTSATVHPHFLLLTTLKHQLVLLSLQNSSVKDLLHQLNQLEVRQQQDDLRAHNSSSLPALSSSGAQQCYRENVRAIEQGGHIVTVIPKQCKVILYMPRGNLETVYPRALVLCELRRMLDSIFSRNTSSQDVGGGASAVASFSKALELARRHRVNMNLLHDHNPSLFLSRLHDFIRDVDDVERLNLFVADLCSEDVTKTMYSQFYDQQTPTVSSSGHGNTHPKQDRVCDSLMKAFNEIDPKRYMLCIMTCYVKKSTKEAENALLLLKTYRDKGEQSIWEKGLRHLQYLLDMETLYRLSLGTYDLSLALAVAERSQLDPREYVPFLGQLEKLANPNYRCYKIDLSLKRYSKALTHLMHCCHPSSSTSALDTTLDQQKCFAECLELIKQHNLYSQGLEHFNTASEERTKIGELFGKWLIQEKRLREASVIYEHCGLFKDAASCYHRLNDWTKWYSCILRSNKVDESHIKPEALLLAERLASIGRIHEAGDVYIHVVKTPAQAVQLFLDNYLWSPASLLQCQYKSFPEEEFSALICSKVTEQCGKLTNDCAKSMKNVILKAERLHVLRKKHQTDYLHRVDTFGENASFMDGADAFSDTSSVFSGSAMSLASGTSNHSQSSSKASGRSAKTRRKADRKKWNSREGSALEEVALIQECHDLIQAGQNLIVHVNDCLENMVLHGGDSQKTRELVESVNCMLQQHKTVIPAIWDDFIVGKLLLEFGTLNVSVIGAEYTGRRFYDMNESFLRFPPVMKTLKVTTCLL